jgi:hypothetical protein
MVSASDRLAAIDRSIAATEERISQQRRVLAELVAEGHADVARVSGSVLCRLETSFATQHASRQAIIREMGNAETSYYGA